MSKNNQNVAITLVKSPIGCQPSHRATLKGLGLRRIRQTVEHRLTPEIQGMINKIQYLLNVEEKV